VPMTRAGTASSQTYQLAQSAGSCMIIPPVCVLVCRASPIPAFAISGNHAVAAKPSANCRIERRWGQCATSQIAPGNFCRRKNLTARAVVPTAGGFLRTR
jgi:hypothetical protein